MEHPFSSFQDGLEKSKEKILSLLKNDSDITIFTTWGNTGDQLIKEGTLQLLEPIQYKKIFIQEPNKHTGKTAVIMGSGGWCRPFHAIAKYLPIIEERFEKVIILPSSFDPSVETIKKTLSNSKAIVFARELISYELIKNLCNADFAYDGAFFFDYSPWKQKGTGTLNAYRIDRERRKEKKFHLPSSNVDISVTCKNLKDWLNTISSYDTVKTDRAHVMIAAAMLEKKVYYRSSNYHKVPAIADFSLKDFSVFLEE